MAASGFNIGQMLKLQGNSNVTTEYNSLSDLFNNVLPNIYVAAGLIIFIMILVGGFMILANATSAEKHNNANQIITSAIIGLVVIFVSYWIIQLIQVLTGIQILNSTL